jgi:hypothetical protein
MPAWRSFWQTIHQWRISGERDNKKTSGAIPMAHQLAHLIRQNLIA